MFVNQLKRYIALSIIYICNRLPIKQNKIILFSYYGAQFGCNPKYITKYIIKHYPKDTFDIVWAFNEPKSKVDNGPFRKVRTMSIRYFYELCTAKVIITNFRTTDLFVKRKEQYYIQTWHSSLRLKQIEKDAGSALSRSYIRMAKKDSLKCDLLLSGCEYSTNIFKRAFWYDGEVFENGTPRNDLLLKNDVQIKETLKKRLEIPSDTKVLLYAPTFRKDNNVEVYDLNYSELSENVENKFGGKWLILVKLHPHVASLADKLTYGSSIKNVSGNDDIQELLLIADVLVSDYSSLMFDFSITKRPCFLYVPDMEEYTTEERKLYFDLNQLPFKSAVNNDELFDKVNQFDENLYQKKLAVFLRGIGSYEAGKASEYLLKRIEQVCFEAERIDIDEAI